MPRPKLVEAVLQMSPERRALSLTAELDRLNAHHSKLMSDVAELQERVHTLEDENAILPLMAKARAASNKAENVRKRMAKVSAELDEAKAASRAKLRAELNAAIVPIIEDYLAKAKATQVAFAKFIEARSALEKNGFNFDCAAVPMGPHLGAGPLLAPDLLAAFETAVARWRGIQRESVRVVKQSATKSIPALQPIEKTAQAAPSSGSFKVSLEPIPPTRPKKRNLVRETAAEGQVLFQFHRPTAVDGRGNFMAGDIIAMSSDEAVPLIRSCCGDVIDPDHAAAAQATFAGAQ